jgi:hypothetical protein
MAQESLLAAPDKRNATAMHSCIAQDFSFKCILSTIKFYKK